VISPLGNDKLWVQITFDVIEEIDQNGNVVETVLLNQTWQATILQNVPEKILRIFTLSTLVGAFTVTIEIRSALYLQSTIVSVVQSESGNSTEYHLFIVESNTNKWSINVTGWTFKELTNSLKLKIGFQINEPVVEMENSFSQDELVMHYTMFTAHSQVLASVPYFIVVDYSFQNLENVFKYNIENASIEFYFPSFLTSMEYDPDFTIIEQSYQGDYYPIVPNNELVAVIASIFGVSTFILLVAAVTFLLRRNFYITRKEAKWKEVSF